MPYNPLGLTPANLAQYIATNTPAAGPVGQIDSWLWNANAYDTMSRIALGMRMVGATDRQILWTLERPIVGQTSIKFVQGPFSDGPGKRLGQSDSGGDGKYAIYLGPDDERKASLAAPYDQMGGKMSGARNPSDGQRDIKPATFPLSYYQYASWRYLCQALWDASFAVPATYHPRLIWYFAPLDAHDPFNWALAERGVPDTRIAAIHGQRYKKLQNSGEKFNGNNEIDKHLSQGYVMVYEALPLPFDKSHMWGEVLDSETADAIASENPPRTPAQWLLDSWTGDIADNDQRIADAAKAKAASDAAAKAAADASAALALQASKNATAAISSSATTQKIALAAGIGLVAYYIAKDKI